MKKNQYDVIVIGAGPAGSICARNLALMGFDVLMVEKRPVVGVPVRCGEATGERARLSDFVEINEDYIETDIHGLILHTPKSRIQYDKNDIGLMLDRTIFDADLANLAQKAGVELCLNARVSDVLPVVNDQRGVRIVYKDQENEYFAKMVVAADGAESLCGRWAGIRSVQVAPKVCSAIEFLLEGEDEFPNHLSFWIGWPGIKKGYVWVFPKVKSKILNVGAGTITPRHQDPNMYEVTMAFKEKFYPNYKLIKTHGGSVPVSGILEESVSDRFLLVGDAAHQTNPLTGGGIASGMYGGEIAAEWIQKGFELGDLSKANLRHYEVDIWERFGKSHRRDMRIRDFMFGIDPESQNVFFEKIKMMFDINSTTFQKVSGWSGFLILMLKKLSFIKKINKNTEHPSF